MGDGHRMDAEGAAVGSWLIMGDENQLADCWFVVKAK